jgi:hypothetical protein
MKKTCITLLFLLVFANSAFAYDVAFNANSLIYHAPTCELARKCTKSCIKIDRTLAQRRGGVPCKICGGLEKISNYKKPNNDETKKTELAEIKRLKDKMTKLMASELERMKTISPTFDSDYQTLHGK